MKIIEIPEPVKLPYKVAVDGKLEDKTQESSMPEFLASCCGGFEKFASGPKMARQYGKIMDKIESVNGEKSVAFEDQDFAVVRDAVNAARWRTPQINRAYLPFYDALESATEE